MVSGMVFFPQAIKKDSIGALIMEAWSETALIIDASSASLSLGGLLNDPTNQ